MTDVGDLDPTQLAHIAGGIGAAAFHWIDAVHRDAPSEVWRGLSADFRLALAQQWLYDTPDAIHDPAAAGVDRDTLAATLSAQEPQHPLWPDCLRASMRAVKSATAGQEHAELGQAPRSRVVGPDMEVIHLIPMDQLPVDVNGIRYHPPGIAVASLALVLRLQHTAWKVAGIGPRLVTPGWPPVWTDLPPEIAQ